MAPVSIARISFKRATPGLQLLDRNHLQEMPAAVVGRVRAAQFQGRIEQALRRVVPQRALGRTHRPAVAVTAEQFGGCFGKFRERQWPDP